MTAAPTCHRENTPVLDLEPVRIRIAERRDAARGPMSETIREIVEADTDMVEALMREVHRYRVANECLREVVAAMRPKEK